jgi:hypothetical protein
MDAVARERNGLRRPPYPDKRQPSAIQNFRRGEKSSLQEPALFAANPDEFSEQIPDEEPDPRCDSQNAAIMMPLCWSAVTPHLPGA